MKVSGHFHDSAHLPSWETTPVPLRTQDFDRSHPVVYCNNIIIYSNQQHNYIYIYIYSCVNDWNKLLYYLRSQIRNAH